MKSRAVDPINRRHFYREFSMESKDDFEGSGPRFFSSLERCRLIFSLIEESVENGGAGLDIDKLVNEQKVSSKFNLGQKVQRVLTGEINFNLLSSPPRRFVLFPSTRRRPSWSSQTVGCRGIKSKSLQSTSSA